MTLLEELLQKNGDLEKRMAMLKSAMKEIQEGHDERVARALYVGTLIPQACKIMLDIREANSELAEAMMTAAAEHLERTLNTLIVHRKCTCMLCVLDLIAEGKVDQPFNNVKALAPYFVNLYTELRNEYGKKESADEQSGPNERR